MDDRKDGQLPLIDAAAKISKEDGTDVAGLERR
jgi:hypothetical protein